MNLMQIKTGFNSRTREGATGDTDPVFYQYDVSIHAPVRVRRGAAKQRD